MDDNRSVTVKSFCVNVALYLSCSLTGVLLKVVVRPHHEYLATTWELTHEFVTTASYSLSAMCLVGNLWFACRAGRYFVVALEKLTEEKEEQARRQREWEEEYVRAQAWLNSTRNDNGRVHSL